MGEAESDKARRRAARQLVGEYHERELVRLLEHVRDGTRFDAGQIDAFDLDDLIHRYKRSARELWKFCANRPESVEWAIDEARSRGEEPSGDPADRRHAVAPAPSTFRSRAPAEGVLRGGYDQFTMPDREAVEAWVRRNEAARAEDRRRNLERSMSERLEEAVRLSRIAYELEANLGRDPDVRAG